MSEFVVAIDQGTTGSTVLVVGRAGETVSRGYCEYKQHYPQPGWVEHDSEEIWGSVLEALGQALARGNVRINEIAAIGITNQRETTLAWDRTSGQSLARAIVWQCRRTAPLCKKLKDDGLEELYRDRTGLVLDPYFSGTKMNWMLNNVPEVSRAAREGTLAFGTVDSFLVWRLSAGSAHVTDVSNASRTLLMNIHTLQWDEELCAPLGVPVSALPVIVDSSGEVARTKGVPGLPDGIPIAGIAGDQQAALFGQRCFEVGEGKITFGTGAFMLVNTGGVPARSAHGLLTTVAWRVNGKVSYALEGSAFIAGAAVQWLRDGLKVISEAKQIEELASAVEDSGGVMFVPALTGLGAPHWRSDARGAIVGITRGTTLHHLARAVIDGIALQNRDIMVAMADDLGGTLRGVRVDGGASANNLLMQTQADLLGVPVLRPSNTETTAMGAAFLAGLGSGFWSSVEELGSVWRLDREFLPSMEAADRDQILERWRRALDAAMA